MLIDMTTIMLTRTMAIKKLTERTTIQKFRKLEIRYLIFTVHRPRTTWSEVKAQLQSMQRTHLVVAEHQHTHTHNRKDNNSKI